VDKDEALRMALEVFGGDDWHEEIVDSAWADKANKAIIAIREVLAQPEQEPVAWMDEYGDVLSASVVDGSGLRNIPLYTAPPHPKPEQEPVAWMHTKLDGVVVPHRPADLSRHPDRWEALYKTPPPCPTCEALARTVMLDQTYHDNISPQRTWVGLTDEEVWDAYEKGMYEEMWFARAIEAKLREKNGG